MKFEALRRLPKLPQRELFAYQTADKLLLDTLEEKNHSGSYLIYDDHFGAIAAGLIDLGIDATQIYWVNESRCSHDSMYLNVTDKLGGAYFDLAQCLEEMPLEVITELNIVSRWSKSKEQWIYFLEQIHTKLAITEVQVNFYSSGMIKYYFPELRSELETLHESDLSRIFKKARLLSSNFNSQNLPEPKTKSKISKLQFNKGKNDPASKLLIDQLPALAKKIAIQAQATIGPSEKFQILDLGAGSGSLGINATLGLLAKEPKLPIELDLVEDNWFSIQALEQNSQINELREKGVLVNILHSNIFRLKQLEVKSWDWILSNPPYHQFNTLTPSLANEFLVQAYHRLNEKASLTWVTSSAFKIPGKVSNHMKIQKLISKSGHTVHYAKH